MLLLIKIKLKISDVVRHLHDYHLYHKLPSEEYERNI